MKKDLEINQWHTFKYQLFKTSGNYYDEKHVALKVKVLHNKYESALHPTICMSEVCEKIREREIDWLKDGQSIYVNHEYGYPCLIK